MDPQIEGDGRRGTGPALIPGKEYTVSGKLMVKETGEPLTVDGKEVTAEKTFVAEEVDGSIILEECRCFDLWRNRRGRTDSFSGSRY